MDLILNHLFGFGNFKNNSQNLATHSANLHTSQISENVREIPTYFINIEYTTNDKY